MNGVFAREALVCQNEIVQILAVMQDHAQRLSAIWTTDPRRKAQSMAVISLLHRPVLGK